MLLDIFEMISGQRMMTSYIRPGGLMDDLPSGFEREGRRLPRRLPGAARRVRDDPDPQRAVPRPHDRHRRPHAADALALGVTGPNLRASGVDWDLRRDSPTPATTSTTSTCRSARNGDCYDRYLVRIAEMRESLKIVQQALERLAERPVDDRTTARSRRRRATSWRRAWRRSSTISSSTPRATACPRGEAYVCIESPRGELGFYIVSDGSAKPYRCHVRAPSFVNLQALNTVAQGHWSPTWSLSSAASTRSWARSIASGSAGVARHGTCQGDS